jgi:hypothetical protein
MVYTYSCVQIIVYRFLHAIKHQDQYDEMNKIDVIGETTERNPKFRRQKSLNQTWNTILARQFTYKALKYKARSVLQQ